jgi:protein-glucosylgalactosylhydroxylysine glucosidase
MQDITYILESKLIDGTELVTFQKIILAFSFAACVCNNPTYEGDSDRYGKIAKKLRLLYNEEEKYHPQYEGYVKGTPIKQADVVLMSYPLNYPMSE